MMPPGPAGENETMGSQADNEGRNSDMPRAKP